MQEISAYKFIKEKLQAIPNSHDKGSLFEKLSRRFLIEHDSANEYESIKLWSDWELRGNKGDRGIDMVITTASKEYIAVQCKFHQDNISLNDISTFLSQLQAGVGEVRFKKGIIISTSKLTRAALEEIEQIRSTGMGIDIDEITEEDFIYSQIDWEKLDPTKTDYIALINITQAAQNRDSSLKNFKNIALTDSLDYLEEKTNKGALPLYEDLKENKDIKDTLADQNIRVIIGNPPYSAGAKSENDNNQNLSHPKLEKLVYEKYGKNSTSKNVGKTTRDTLIQSIRMASDVVKDKGVIGFVVNGGFIDSKSADGFRKCVAKEFAHLYVLNLRGNQRTSGEVSKKEGGKIFGSGSRATIAIIFFVKDTSVKNNTIDYYDIGDYLKREEKLHKLASFTDLDAIPFETIIPNHKGDWINQREDGFEKLIPLKRDKTLKNPSVFDINSGGVVSGRDPWVYNSSPKILTQSVQKCIDTYNADLERFNARFREAFKQRTKGVKSAELYKQLNDKEITTDKTKIAWTRALKQEFIKNKNLQESHEKRIRLAMYRPFNKQWLYFDKNLNEKQSQLPKIFPNKDAQNVVINTTKGKFSALVSSTIPDIHFIGDANAYPLYYYDDLGNRHYAISGYVLNLFRRHYKDNAIVEEEIFYYIYAILHHKGYLEKYKNSLAKEAPCIALSDDFKELSTLGKELGDLHLNYESGEMHTSVKYTTLMNAEIEGYYDVEKMTKKGDCILYNQNITITKIPQKAFDYVVNGKSATDWVIERYQKTTDKDSLIENNPNDYAGGQYVFGLLCRVIKLYHNKLGQSI